METIEITTGINGYPSHLHKAHIGFDTFDQAEDFAKQNNGVVVALRKRDGWQFWESEGRVFEPFRVDSDTYGDDYSTETSREHWEDTCRDLLSAMISDGTSLEDMSRIVKDMIAVSERIDHLDENEAVLLYHGEYCDTIKTHTMSYNEDVWSHQIGVEIL